ncbi:MAG: damage-inducible protein CinA, partial [Proteobacteria bacterium]
DKLNAIGIQVVHTLTCDDSLSSIVNGLEFLNSRSDLVIVSGGLGPTSDDQTREAVAEFTRCKLVLYPEVLNKLQALFAARSRSFDPSNNKQAHFPENAAVIPNDNGTAAGFLVQRGAQPGYLICLPGIPGELFPMLEEGVIPLIRRELFPQLALFPRRILRVFGVPESRLNTKLQALSLPGELAISYRAHFPEVHIILKAAGTLLSEAELGTAAAACKQAIGEEFVYSEDEARAMNGIVHELLISRGLTISLAESCTGGILGSLLTELSGSSAYFLGGVLSYSNQVKVNQLGVPKDILEDHGAVSHETAKCMAQGVRERFSSSLALSVTGIAGPQGGSAEKPVGTFFVGYADSSSTQAYQFFFPSSREKIRTFAAWTALDILRRRLSSCI